MLYYIGIYCSYQTFRKGDYILKKLFFNLFCTLFFFLGVYYTYDSFYMIKNNKNPILMPNFVGMNYQEVIKISKEANLNIELVAQEYSNFPKNQVYLQIPEYGKVIKKSKTIQVAVSKGPYTIELKNLKGLDISIVKKELQRLGLNIKNISYTKHNLPFNQIIGVYPNDNEILYRKKQISLLVSSGLRDKKVFMPNLIGLDYDSAVKLLNSVELISNNPRYIENKWMPEGSVVSQSYSTNKELISGSFVDLTITKK